jgi:prepilin peptidase CpaA
MSAFPWIQPALLASYSIVLIWSAITDFRSRIIPNSAVFALVILFSIYCLAGFASWADGLIGGLIIFFPTLVLFHFGLMGGGDAKMMTAIALWVGQQGVLAFCLLTSLAGGVLAIFYMVRRWRESRALIDTDPADLDAQAIVLPYGVAIAVGGLTTIWIWQLAYLGVI